MAGLPSSIAAVAPFNDQQLTQTPQDLVITFSGIPVAALMGTYDIALVELNHDGTTTPMWDADTAPLEETDPTGTDLIIPMQTYDPSTFSYDNLTLLAGTYEIELVGDTGLSFFASGMFGPGPQLWDPTQNYTISQFTVLGQGATFSGATRLGTIGPNVQTVLGSLNPDSSSSSVDIYQFTLPQGHFWQVGLSVSAHSIGSPLLPALSIFDASGDVIATRNSGQGLFTDPDDPYLFTGLTPGTYDVAVSDSGNLPYGASGFNPNLGLSGTGGLRQSGGPFPFELGLVADAHDQPTELTSLSVDRADITNSSPTGLTLTFSAPINLSQLFTPDVQETVLNVVDSSGRVWPITAESYEVTDAQLTMIFDQPLPAGTYTLTTPVEGGIDDLADKLVIAPGEPAGVLGSFTVAPPVNAQNPNNLSVLWPSAAHITWPTDADAFDRTIVLAPGQVEAYRWVVTVPGFYNLQILMASGQLSITNSANGQTTVITPDDSQQLSTYVFQLNEGVYSLRFHNIGSKPLQVNWLLKIGSLDWDKILDSGIAQTSVLTLSLYNPTTADSNSSLTGSPTAGAQALSGLSGLNSSSSGPITASLFVTMNTSLIGQPMAWSQDIAAVGPTVEAGSVAVADSAHGLDQGNTYGLMLDTSLSNQDEDRLAEADPASAEPLQNPSTRVAAQVAPRSLDPQARTARADELALAQAERLISLGGGLKGWLTSAPLTADTESVAAAPTGPVAIAQDDRTHGRTRNRSDRSNRSAATAQVDLATVVSLTIAGVITYRLRRPLERWWKQSRQPAIAARAPGKRFCRGPHPASTRARATTRPHAARSARKGS